MATDTDNDVGQPPEDILRVEAVCKSYGETVALDNVAFAVGAGQIFGYLGPNGAGKTTTINILCGLVRRDAGEVSICGADIDRDPVAVKQDIGVAEEESNLYPELTCRRNLEYLGELYGLSRAARRRRADELLDDFDLVDKAQTPFRALSRGMKRRLTVAAALIHSPRLVFLDEPTAGLDVPSARALRQLIRNIKRDGTTVFLTTHNLAEAESLCDRICILAKGRVVAEGTAAEIRLRVAESRTISLVLSDEVTGESIRQACPAVKTAAMVGGKWTLGVTDLHAAASQIVALAQRSGWRILEITSGGDTLEDAFMTILDANAGKAEADQ